MSVCEVVSRSSVPPLAAPRFTILAIDGGGIRGVIAARLLAELERLLGGKPGAPALTDCFDLIAGTSTGGLIALGLAAPGENGRSAMTAADQVGLYTGGEGRAIFERPLLRRLPLVGGLVDLFRPKYGLGRLRGVLERHLGGAVVGDALTEVLITAYDMHGREPRFFKRWTAGADETAVVDAALATAAAPTYFPSHGLGERALVDGGVFASNPTVAAIAEALKRTEEPAGPQTGELLVVSVGTGHYEVGYEQGTVERWGALDWILPRGKRPLSGEPPLIGAMLDGQSDAAHHWAHVLLNHKPGERVDGENVMGAGPRYYRYQVDLREPLPIDDASEGNMARLSECAAALIKDRGGELDALAEALAVRARSTGEATAATP